MDSDGQTIHKLSTDKIQNVNKPIFENLSTFYGWGVLLYMRCFKNRVKFTRSIQII